MCVKWRYWEEASCEQRKGSSRKRVDRQARLEGVGLSKESTLGSSAAGKPNEIGQEEDANMVDEAERKKFRSLAATPNCMSSDRSDVQIRREGNMHEDGDADTRELGQTEEGSHISERSRNK